MMNVAMMFQAPSVHLAQSISSRPFFAIFHLAKFLGVIMRVGTRRTTKFHGVGVIPINSDFLLAMLADNLGNSNDVCHANSIAHCVARNPEFYTGTFCCRCGKHFPLVNEDGSRAFAWIPRDGSCVGE
jgi:hypothetical protein